MPCNISMHILHTVLYTFPEMLTRRICLTIKSCLSFRSLILLNLMFDLGVILSGEIRCLSLLGVKRLKLDSGVILLGV